MFDIKPHHILVCRNDALGDTILSLPCCGVIKKYFPGVRISFLGKTYTKEVALLSSHVDEFINYDEVNNIDSADLQAFFKARNIDTALLLRSEKNLSLFIKRSGIKYRIGNLHVMRHLTACNRFASFGHNSNLNEAQFNLKMLRPLGIRLMPEKAELSDYYGIANIPALNDPLRSLLSPVKFNLILHPMTTGNGPAWQEKNFQDLIKAIDTNKFKVFVSGSAADNEKIKQWSVWNEDVHNIAGETPLSQLISFISHADGLIAGSTGPIHIAAALGVHALGLYPSLPISKSDVRWGPIGKHAETIQSGGTTLDNITVNDVLQKINSWEKIA